MFLESQGPDMLGVGTNMVKSIRYWMQACGLLVKDGNKEILSDMAEIIYMNSSIFGRYFLIMDTSFKYY
ncbi:MAG: DUF4007 family protein [Blautia wexlerae]